ncbi:MAG TPA: hypothetical protein VKS24_00610 [Bradyrhizobium sp.]|nr:hypothetical protein [Bradyrhizobium sp.]
MKIGALPVFAWQLFAWRPGTPNSCRLVHRQIGRLFGVYLLFVVSAPDMTALIVICGALGGCRRNRVFVNVSRHGAAV